MKWRELSASDKAKLVSQYIKLGITSTREMEEDFNSSSNKFFDGKEKSSIDTTSNNENE